MLMINIALLDNYTARERQPEPDLHPGQFSFEIDTFLEKVVTKTASKMRLGASQFCNPHPCILKIRTVDRSPPGFRSRDTPY